VLPQGIQIQLQEQAVKLHQALGLRGMSRTDMRVDHTGRLFVLDINAMPNLDPLRSLLPALCSHYGVNLTQLLRSLADQSIQAASSQNEEEWQSQNEPMF
jgi:D-alanine-D-alanine ligase